MDNVEITVTTETETPGVIVIEQESTADIQIQITEAVDPVTIVLNEQTQTLPTGSTIRLDAIEQQLNEIDGLVYGVDFLTHYRLKRDN